MWTKTRARDERCSKYIISLCCYHALSCALTGRVVKGVPSPGLNPLVPSGRRTIPNCLNFAPFNPGFQPWAEFYCPLRDKEPSQTALSLRHSCPSQRYCSRKQAPAQASHSASNAHAALQLPDIPAEIYVGI